MFCSFIDTKILSEKGYGVRILGAAIPISLCGTFSYEAVKMQFRTSFLTEVSPDKSMIYRWVERFRKYGTVQNLNCKSDYRSTHSGRPKKRTAEVIETVRNSVDFSPKRSIKRRK